MNSQSTVGTLENYFSHNFPTLYWNKSRAEEKNANVNFFSLIYKHKNSPRFLMCKMFTVEPIKKYKPNFSSLEYCSYILRKKKGKYKWNSNNSFYITCTKWWILSRSIPYILNNFKKLLVIKFKFTKRTNQQQYHSKINTSNF